MRALTIWHSPNENETYTLEGANANLFDASAAGAVSARDEIRPRVPVASSPLSAVRPTELVRYELTLALSDGGSDGAAGVDGGVDAAVAGGGRGFDAVARLDGDGGSEGDGG